MSGLARRGGTGPKAEAGRERAPIVEHIVTDAAESFLWRLDDYPWERNVWNIHPEYEVHLVRNASGVALVGDHIERFEPGYLALVGSDLPHDWVTPLPPGARIAGRDIVLQFDRARLEGAAASFPELAELGGFLELARRGLAFHGETRRRGAELMEAMGAVRGFARLNLFLDLLRLMASRGDYRVLSSRDFAPARDGAAQGAMRQALTQLIEGFTQDIRLPDLARPLGMSDWAFSRFFKKHTGNSFTDYLTTLRIGLACKLLAESDRPVTAVCFAVGYANASNFNRIFRQQRGMTPSAYRDLARQRLAVRAPGPPHDDPLQAGASPSAFAASQHA